MEGPIRRRSSIEGRIDIAAQSWIDQQQQPSTPTSHYQNYQRTTPPNKVGATSGVLQGRSPLSSPKSTTSSASLALQKVKVWAPLILLLLLGMLCVGAITHFLSPTTAAKATASTSSRFPEKGLEQHAAMSFSSSHPEQASHRGLRSACVPRAYCSQVGIQCDFSKITLCEDEEDEETTAIPAAALAAAQPQGLPLSRSDLKAWQSLYITLKGQEWTKCSENFASPCDCTFGVECEDADAEQRIVGIRLQDNNLNGPLPVKPLLALNALRWLDLKNNATKASNQVNISSSACFPLSRCKGEMLCSLPGVDMSTVQYCKDKSAFRANKLGLFETDLQVWQEFYTATKGEKWNHCSSNFADPCKCGKALEDVSSNQYVACAVVDGKLRITRVHLPNNNLAGALPPSSVLSGWTALRLLDLSYIPHTSHVAASALSNMGSPNRLSGPCLSLPACDKPRSSCILALSGVELCTRAAATHRPKISKSDALAFTLLRETLSPPQGWVECDTALDPCNDCYNRVECELDKADGMLYITKLDLTNNRLFGKLPLNITEHGFTKLRSLLLSNNKEEGEAEDEEEEANRNELEFDGGSCIDYELCDAPGALCEARHADVHFCGEEELKLAQSELEAWTAFYDAMNGKAWKKCSDARAHPCSHPQCVQCASPNDTGNAQPHLSIVGIKLNNNNLALTISELPSLDALVNLQNLDLSLNAKLTEQVADRGACWRLPHALRTKNYKVPVRLC